jgi:hypothetical protein
MLPFRRTTSTSQSWTSLCGRPADTKTPRLCANVARYMTAQLHRSLAAATPQHKASRVDELPARALLGNNLQPLSTACAMPTSLSGHWRGLDSDVGPLLGCSRLAGSYGPMGHIGLAHPRLNGSFPGQASDHELPPNLREMAR